MKQKLEQVIAELVDLKGKSTVEYEKASAANDAVKGMAALGEEIAYSRAINLLREVLAADETSDTRIIAGNERDTSGE